MIEQNRIWGGKIVSNLSWVPPDTTCFCRLQIDAYHNFLHFCAFLFGYNVYILGGRAKSVSAKHYAIYELDKMAEAYKEAWQRFGVNADELGIV